MWQKLPGSGSAVTPTDPGGAMIAELVAATALWLTGLGVPVEAPSVTVSTDPAAACGVVAPKGMQVDGCKLPTGIVLSEEPNSDMIHELAHEASVQARGPLLTREQSAWDEAGAASLERDLVGPWFRQVVRPGSMMFEGAPSYPAQVAWLRGMSSAACRCDPDSRAARVWRRVWVTGDREAMLRQAASVPLEGLAP